MIKRNKDVDPLPEEFASIEEAAEFWDTHDLTDYEEYLEPVDAEIVFQRRHFGIEVDEECFTALRESAKRQNRPIKQIASEILNRNLGD
jgi:hypothetical protein